MTMTMTMTMTMVEREREREKETNQSGNLSATYKQRFGCEKGSDI